MIVFHRTSKFTHRQKLDKLRERRSAIWLLKIETRTSNYILTKPARKICKFKTETDWDKCILKRVGLFLLNWWNYLKRAHVTQNCVTLQLFRHKSTQQGPYVTDVWVKIRLDSNLLQKTFLGKGMAKRFDVFLLRVGLSFKTSRANFWPAMCVTMKLSSFTHALKQLFNNKMKFLASCMRSKNGRGNNNKFSDAAASLKLRSSCVLAAQP